MRTRPKNIFVLGQNLWETDFINELFSGTGYVLCETTPAQLAVYHPLDDVPCVIVYTSNTLGYDAILKIVRRVQPRIVFHLSDEWGQAAQHNELCRHVPVVFRQYHHAHYPKYSNLYYLPLGYMVGMIGGQKSTAMGALVPAVARRYKWGFVGNIKQDRIALIMQFLNWGPNFVNEGAVMPHEMKAIYCASTFVPIGRGNVGLNCLRLYEASICGAIPVVVGGEQEIRDTFKYEEDPPWLFAESWKSALDKCQQLYHDRDALVARQSAVLRWWAGRMAGVLRIIREALGVLNDGG